ncbi:MAG: hypothetical protein NT026_00615 [Candidatus Staskawiczbacteria bacterium]|nr:hypothetical protein [Candidatus Staskawiczbacteria bacterium]
MKAIFFKIIFYIFVCAVALLPLQPAAAQIIGGAYVQTNAATNIYSNQATLNGYFSFPYYYTGTNYVWFQWGTDTNYQNSTSQQLMSGNSNSFSQYISNLNPNTTYHFRAALQNNNAITYGQDMTFYTNSSGNYYGNSSLYVRKQVINYSSGILNWQASVNANPTELIGFAITLQAVNGDVHNVIVRDILPENLTYFRAGTTTLDGQNYVGDITSGINIGTIMAGNTRTIIYQAITGPSQNFAYGTTTLSNNATITSSESGTQTASAQVIVNRSQVYGATSINTGITNNPVSGSFFLPLFLIIFMSWLYFTGRVSRFSNWIGAKIK